MDISNTHQLHNVSVSNIESETNAKISIAWKYVQNQIMTLKQQLK